MAGRGGRFAAAAQRVPDSTAEVPRRQRTPAGRGRAAASAAPRAVRREQQVQRVVGVAQQRGGARELLVQHRARLAVHGAAQVVGELAREGRWRARGRGRGQGSAGARAAGRPDPRVSRLAGSTGARARPAACLPVRLPIARPPCSLTSNGSSMHTRCRSLPTRRVQSLSSLCRQPPRRTWRWQAGRVGGQGAGRARA